MQAFNLLDYLLLGIFLFFALRGFFRGIFLESVSVLGVVLAFWLAANHSEAFVPYLTSFIKSTSLAEMLAPFVVFMGVTFIIWALASLIQRRWPLPLPHLVDMSVGSLIGLVKGWLLSCVVVAGVSWAVPASVVLQTSTLMPMLEPGTAFLEKYIKKTERPGFLEKLFATTDNEK